MRTIKRIYRFVLVAGAVVLCGCNESDNPVSGTQLQGGSTASAFIRVQNVHSEAPVKGALVTIEGSGSCTTNVNGVAQFNDLRIGAHVISASLAGYEPVVSEVIIQADSSYSVPFAMQTSMMLPMYRKSAVVRGKIYYRKDNILYPISQIPLELELSPLKRFDGEMVPSGAADFLQPVRSVKTLPDGSFFFDSVPEFARVELKNRKHHVGGVLYGTLEGGGGEVAYTKAAGDTCNILPLILLPESNGYFTIVSVNTDSITDTAALRVTFSEAVDTSEYHAKNTRVYVSLASMEVLISQKWNKSLTTLYIKPYDGVWQNREMYTITIGQNVYSLSGNVLMSQQTYHFSVGSSNSGTDVKNLWILSPQRIDYGTSSVRLQWSRLPGAIGYSIYSRSKIDSIWSRNTASNSGSDTTIYFNTSNQFLSDNYVDVMVLGVFQFSESDPATAKTLRLRDNTRPKITSGSAETVYTVYDCNNSASSVSLQRQLYSPLRFSEPMDTTKKPTVTVKEASYSYYGDTTYALPKDSIRFSWSTLTQLVVQAVIPASKNAAYDSIMVDLTNITDRNGNKVSFSDSLELPILKYVTR